MTANGCLFVCCVVLCCVSMQSGGLSDICEYVARTNPNSASPVTTHMKIFVYVKGHIFYRY